MNRRGFLKTLFGAAVAACGLPVPKVALPKTRPSLIYNAATLREEDWIYLDHVVLKCARERLRSWADLSAPNEFDGIAHG